MSNSKPADPSLLEEVRLLRLRVLELERSELEKEHTRVALKEYTHLAALTGEVTVALTQNAPLYECLQHCVQALVTHLGAAFARIWIVDKEAQMLDLVASAGLYIHLDGSHGRVPIGKFKIGRIAAERQPHLTNAVLTDPQISDRDWAEREGMIAFAGYPLLIEGEVVGVMALFARIPLSSAVLDMMASVANAIALGVERKHAEEERARLWEETSVARAQAENALDVHNDFLSSISHDLKTPLAVMRGNVQLFQRRLKRDTQIDPIWSAERLAVIEASIMKMNGMVGDLLDVAKLQAGQNLDLEMRPFFFLPIVHHVYKEQQETTKRHHLLLQIPSEDILVRGDAVRLDRVLTNLFANAIKYSPEGGKIAVSIEYEEESELRWITLRIQDEGVGIPAADLPSIFDPFFRATNVRGQMQGTGVGLASAAQVIREHGGSISVRSEEGQGSCFLVRLPAQIEQEGINAEGKM